MVGKKYLQDNLKEISSLVLTNGVDTYKSRDIWNVDKTHSNDAVTITKIFPINDLCIDEYVITPQRRKRENVYNFLMGFKHRDLVKYTPRNKKVYIGYIIGLRYNRKSLQIRVNKNKRLDGISPKSCTLLWRFTNLVWRGELI